MTYRTNNCGSLRLSDAGKTVMLSGWVQRVRNLGGMTFIDLRDRYGITQLAFNMETNASLCEKARDLGREYVIRISGDVMERSNKNKDLATGEIEIRVSELDILNASKVPPFTIEDESDGGESLRMQYRFLDLRRNPLQKKLKLRHKMLQACRKYLSEHEFLEIETPYLIKSTPEGARDFVVPSRLHHGQFYALPQSPQTFKQLLMMSGYDRYFQIVRCFRDEDFRADRQPEFTQIDCEMTFVTQEEILERFSGLVKHLFKSVLDIQIDEIPQMTYDEAMRDYGTDKPDLRFGMKFHYLNDLLKGTDFIAFSNVLETGGNVCGINVKNAAGLSRKQLDALTDFVKEPEQGMNGLVWVKYNEDGSLKSPIDKFFDDEAKKGWAKKMGSEAGDLMLILAGSVNKTRNALNALRLKVADLMELKDPFSFKPLWVIDFPLMELNEETGKYTFAHHPFTSPKTDEIDKLKSDPESVRANCYDFVLNGHECASGSIRIHDRKLQEQVFDILNIDPKEREEKFGFLLRALEYGAPPHGGIAFGFDRLCALFSGVSSIREVIAFPKNNAGRDVMLDAPGMIDVEQLNELGIKLK
jgi:aspartyl-tRNA synthetase